LLINVYVNKSLNSICENLD